MSEYIFEKGNINTRGEDVRFPQVKMGKYSSISFKNFKGNIFSFEQDINVKMATKRAFYLFTAK